MSTYATFYLSKAQKFDLKTKTDEQRDEIKIEIKTMFDNVTLGLSREQAKDLAAALQNEISPKGAVSDRLKDDIPF
jgi:hypothetical protein